MPVHRRLVAVLIPLVILAPLVWTSTAAAQEVAGGYSPPVDGVVVDPFRLPDGPYGPGNRGLEYETEPGAMVRAAGPGEVVFAGPVGGALHVTIRHGDGLRTSYSFLADVRVDVGQTVATGQVIGSSSGRMHFGVRLGGDYIDPALLLVEPTFVVRLVPLEGPPDAGGPGALAELVALVDLTRAEASGAFGSLVGLFGQRVPPIQHILELTPLAVIVPMVRDLREQWPGAQPCSDAGLTVAAPAERRLAVLVAGIGSTSESASIDDIDTASLGYAGDDVVRFSYLGGVTNGGGAAAGIQVTSYGAADTSGDMAVAGDRLAELLADLAAANPGVPIDVLAHSQGGVVARVALVSRTPPDEVGLVATLGAPLDGTDLATAIAAVRSRPGGAQGLALLRRVLGQPLDPGADSVAQLSETSMFIDELGRRPLPDGVDYLSVAARGDLVVPSPHTRLPGVTSTVVDLVGPSAHADLPGSDAVTRELRLALDGRPPTCRSALTVLTDVGWGRGLAWAEDLLGAAAWELAG